MGEKANRLPNQISGGEKERVAIARSIVNEPPVLLADEPTGNLDTKTTREIMELLLQLNQEGMTIVMVTHSPDCAGYAQRILRVTDGRLEEDNSKIRRIEKWQKNEKKRNPCPTKTGAGGRKLSYWMIVAAIFLFFSAGLVVKLVYSPVSGNNSGSALLFQSASSNNANLDGQVQLVAANFKCACGQCGELFLIDCTCDMPRGAIEEKSFIRNKLRQGMTVDQVIVLMDQEYGHRII